jgi:hypothetical protein
MSQALQAQVAEKLADEAIRFGALAQDSRVQTTSYRRAAAAADLMDATRAYLLEEAGNYQSGAKYFQRIANANARALEQWRAGVRPEPLANGGWLLPSKSDGAPHIITKSGDWVCTCAAGSSDHWAKSLIVAIEMVADELDAFDDPVTDEVNALIAEATNDSSYARALSDVLELF